MGLSRRQFIVGAAGAGLILLSHPLPRIIPAWGSSLAFGASIKYVSNRTSSGGNGTLSNPYQVSEIWSNAVPGDEFIFLNGTYQGSNSMIDSLVHGGGGVGGSTGSFITLRAETDGRVFIDGQNSFAPFRLAGNHHMILTGFNVGRSGNGSTVYTARNSGAPCQWIEFKRICAWDAPLTQNAHVFSLAYARNLLVEDCAGWGGGRKVFEVYNGPETPGDINSSGGYGGGGTTLRRCFGQWGKFTATTFGPRHTFSISYNYTNVLAENIIATWDDEPGGTIDNNYDLIGHDGLPGIGSGRNVHLYGSLAYLRQNQTSPVPQLISFPGQIGGQEIRDCYACIEAGPNHSTKKPFVTGQPQYPAEFSIFADNASIRNSKPSQQGSGWTYSNFSEAGPRSLPYMPKYVNGVKAGTPLFPWPMNQRIIDARILSGRSAVNVTATVQQVLGGGAGDNLPPDAPTDLRAF